MKKTLLLSVVASTMIMAGGDIAPVEPAVVVPAPVAVAAPAPVAACSDGWKFNGQAVVYYQTADEAGAGAGSPVNARSLFAQDSSSANAGLSLSAVNSNVIAGIGAGVELVGLGTLGLEEDVVSNIMQSADGNLNGGAINQLFLTYGIGNTSLKVGRQTLPQALSPLAYSENWNVFQNTYEAALIVNSDLPQTTLVGAWVRAANSDANLNHFGELNDSDGVYMLTAQNKSIDGLTLTGSAYLANSMITKDALYAGWLDAGFNLAGFETGLQGAYLAHDAFANDTTAVGAKIGGKFDIFNVSLTGSHTDGDLGVFNAGTMDSATINPATPATFMRGGTNSLYTTLEANAAATGYESSTVTGRAALDALGGTFGLAAAYSDFHASALGDAFVETDLTYATKVGCVDLLGAYIWQTDDNSLNGDKNNIIRAVARYNF